MKLLQLAIPLLIASPVFAPAMFVDSFSDGGANLEISSIGYSGRHVSTGPVAISGSPFATREMTISFGLQRLVVDAVQGVLEYKLREPPVGQQGNSQGYIRITYATDVPVNVLEGGANAFRFMFDSATTSGQWFPANLYVDAAGDRVGYSWGFTLGDIFQQNDGAFAVDVPFSVYDRLDLTQVDRIQFDGYRIFPEASFRLTSISTVPEPSTMSLVLVFGLSLYSSRRLRTKASRRLTRLLVNS